MVFLDVTNAIWLFVIIFMLHDFEEIISVEHWANNTKSKLNERNTWINQRIWSFWNVNSYSFAKRDVVIFMVMSIITVITIFNLHQTWSIPLYTSFLVFILFHNVLHILQTIMLRTYTPGLYTAILLVTPYSIFLLTLIN
ncbi:HXXEE domain-containing protein [Neobacillus sp. PS2-9]|uniref:HXXEE domain-containing protein n=1 Tax=Neobacillus sp. PS2-9 TaxID=3070676 RepID=UPI0027E1629F|nr:HXXEE domain-containing protein [Neobacillus sp. PS2-9]WML56165.1 HXXEE domain-containing protein [Neobacillus sp. PS2-9]